MFSRPHPLVRRRLPSLASVALPAAVFAAACASSPPGIQPPELIAITSHYAGDPIGGLLGPETTLELEFNSDDVVEVHAQLYVLSRMPIDGMEPLSEDIRFIIGGQGSDPLAPSSLVAPGARIATGAAATALAADIRGRGPESAVESFSLHGLVVPSVTTVMAAVYAQPIELLGYRPSERRISVHVWREDLDADSLAVALVVSDIVQVVEEGDVGAGDEGDLVVRVVPRRERLILDRPLAIDGSPLLVAVPARFDPDGKIANIVILEARSVGSRTESSDTLAEELEALRVEVCDAALAGAGRHQQLEVEERLRQRRLKAIDALSDSRTRRAAIVELGGGSLAPLVTELALMGGDEILDRLSGRLIADTAELQSLAGDPDVLAWRLEREAILLFTQASLDDDLPAEYEALLLRYTGEAGRYPGTIEDALTDAKSLDEFYSRIFQENYIALEDSRPSGRIRAFDWLAANGIAIPDFDPLGSSRDRRAALRAWAESVAEDAAGTDVEATAGEDKPS